MMASAARHVVCDLCFCVREGSSEQEFLDLQHDIDQP